MLANGEKHDSLELVNVSERSVFGLQKCGMIRYARTLASTSPRKPGSGQTLQKLNDNSSVIKVQRHVP